jgi:hypothetical protein
MHSNLPSLSRMAIATHTPPPLARVGGVGLVGAVEADALLSMLAVEGLSIDAPGDSRASKVRGGHFGERADSAQMAVRLIILSRVLLTKDASVLAAVLTAVHGAELLNQLLVATLRLATLASRVEEASGPITHTNMQTLFGMTGSTLMRQPSYESLFGLPDRLSWIDARLVYTALLDALAEVRMTEPGAAIEALLNTNATTSDATPAAVVASFVAAVEASATARINAGTRDGAGAYTTSSSAGHATPPPLPILPAAQAPSSPFAPPVATVDPTLPLDANVQRRVAAHLSRFIIDPAEVQALVAALTGCLHALGSNMGPNGAEARRQLATITPFGTAIADANVAQVWASTLQVLEQGHIDTLETFTRELAQMVSLVTSTVATAAMGL